MIKEEQNFNQQEAVQSDIEQSNSTTADKFTQEIDKIDKELETFNDSAGTPEEIQALQKAREGEYEKEMANLEGIQISEESKKEIYSKMVDSAISQAAQENEKYDELLEKRASAQVANLFKEDESGAMKRLEGLKNTIGEKDYKIALNILKSSQELFDRNGQLLHATNSFALKNMQDLGKISGGLWQKGASFTDGRSDVALSFNLMWEDLKTKGGINPETNLKKINGAKYGGAEAKKDDFVDFLVEKNKSKTAGEAEQEEYRKKITTEADKQYHENWDIYKDNQTFDQEFNGKLYGILIPEWQKAGKNDTEIDVLKNEFIERGKIYKEIITNRPDEKEIEQMFGVTMTMNKDKISSNKDELTSGQSEFEVRSIGEVDFDNVEKIFVPQAKIKAARELIKNQNIEIKASEELEIIRMLEKG